MNIDLKVGEEVIDEDACNSEIEILKQDIDKLYAIIKSYHEQNEVPNVHVDPQHISLLPQLRPYQKKAVKWMVYREKFQDPELSKQIHPLYTEVNSQNGDVPVPLSVSIIQTYTSCSFKNQEKLRYIIG